MDFLQLAGNYVSNRASNRANQAIEPFADPAAYLDQRMDANVAPVQTTQINPAEAAQQDFIPGGELAIERPGTPVSQYLQQVKQMSMPAQQTPNMSVPVQPEPELPPNAFPDPNAQISYPQGVAAPGSASEAAAMSAAPTIYERFRDNQNDLKSVSAVAFDDTAPGAVRYAANDKLLTAMNNQNQIKKTTAEVDAALSDPSGKGAMKMLNAIAREREDGSLLKAIFYQRMGLNDLAKAEQLKLGAADNYQPVALPDGRQGYVKVNYQGAPIAGWTDAGEMTPDELINAQIGTKGSDVGKQPYKHRTTGELYFLRTTQNGRAQMVNTKGQVYTGDTNQLYAYGIGSDLQIAKEKKLQDYAIDMANAPTLEGRKAYAKQLMDYAGQNDPGDGSFYRAAQAKINAAGFDIQNGQVVGTGGTTTTTTTTQQPSAPTTTEQPGTTTTTTTEQQAGAVKPDTSGKVITGTGTNKAVDTMRVDPSQQKQLDQNRLATLNTERANLERDLAAEKNPASRKEIQKLLDGNAREIAGTVKSIATLDKQIQSGGGKAAAESVPGGTTYVPKQFSFRPPRPGEGAAVYERDRKAAETAFNAQEERNKKIFEENLKREQSLLEKRQSLPIEQEGKERDAFVKLGTDTSKAASDGQVVAGARREQIKIIKDQPAVVGLVYGSGTEYDVARRYLIRSINGYYDSTEGSKEREKDLLAIGKNPALMDAVQQLESRSADVNQRTIRETAPVGALSDMEQRMNAKNNMANITESHPMAVANKLNQSLFASNLLVAKGKFLDDGYASGQFSTRTGFEKAWKPIEARLLKEYEGIYDARVRMIKPYDEALRKDPNNPKLIEDRKRAIIHSMTVYPAPEYNSSTNSWSYGSDAARKAAKKTAIDNVLKGK